MSGIASVLGQGWFGPNNATQTLASTLAQYQNEPGGVDVFAFSGSAQAFVTGANGGLFSTNNIASLTYLSPGIAPGQSLNVGVADTQAFAGGGVVDFLVTLPARLSGGRLASLGTKGHNFRNEFNAARVQSRANPPGSRGPCVPNALQHALVPLISVGLQQLNFNPDEFNLLQVLNLDLSDFSSVTTSWDPGDYKILH